MSLDVDELNKSILTYKTQLEQVNRVLEACTDDNKFELLELKANLEEVINLTQENVLATRKAELLVRLEGLDQSETSLNSQPPASSSSEHPDSCAASTSQNIASLEQYNLNIRGTLVRAPHSFEWGGFQHHNAAILSIESADTGTVRVMFLQPTNSTMKICQYYLQDNCKYTEESCPHSHGFVVEMDLLREYTEPPGAELLNVGDQCLARYEEDDLWYKAVVVDKHEDNVLQVMFPDYGDETSFLSHDDILVTEIYSSSDSSSDEEEISQDSFEEEFSPQLLDTHSHEPLASWETHTKGVASKLMVAMGYKVGQGLGKLSQGRIEPVPIVKLPAGKSLDKIMQLKERTGNSNLFDVLKVKKKRKHHHKGTDVLKKPGRHKLDVFSYLNKSLKKQFSSSLASHRTKIRKAGGGNEAKLISKTELSKKSDRGVNIQVFKTEEEVSKVEREILAIKQRLEVNRTRKDVGGIQHLEQKLSQAQSYLEKLRASQRELQRHKGQREGRRKLTVF